MFNEIREQPAVARAIVQDTQSVIPICNAIRSRDIRLIYIVARGTSDHAAQYAKYLFEIEHQIPVALAAPSTLTLYHSGPKFDEHSLIISISQSGAGADVCSYVDHARQSGALTLAITNTKESLLAKAAEFAIITPAGVELSVAATKTYTSALVTIALISATLANDTQRLQDLQNIPDLLDKTLDASPAAKSLAAGFTTMENCIVLGRGYNYATALELGLKLTETSSIGAQAFSAADFQHGPIARISPSFPCILIAPEGPSLPGIQEMAQKLTDRKAALIVITSTPQSFNELAQFIPVPPGIPEWLSPIAYIIAGQLFAYELCIAKGKSPDNPVGLNKVTSTM